MNDETMTSDELNRRLEPPRIPTDFGYTDEHGLAQKEARRFLEDRCPLASLRDRQGNGYDAAVWKDLCELGWVGLVTPESRGGAGLGHLHLGLLFEEMGRVLYPSPFFASVLSLALLERVGSDAQANGIVPAILDGERVATVALDEPDGSWDASNPATTSKKSGDGYVLDGIKAHVLFGSAADVVFVPARDEAGEVSVFAVDVPTSGVTITDDVPIDSTRPTSRVVLDGARVPTAARLEGDAATTLASAQLFGCTMLAAEMAGAMESVLKMTRDYAAERRQFGRAIGSFQAVKHPLVDMMLGAELVRSAALAAAAAHDHDRDAVEIAARVAKALASDWLAFAVQKGVQLHGGFGFTWDCDMHFFFKRAMFSRGALGDAPYHRARLAAALFDS